jgi:oligopeptidase B
MFDCNELAEGHKYFKLSGLSISVDNQYATYALDLVGRRIYTLHVKKSFTGEILKDTIENATGNSTWANDNQTIFYPDKTKKTLRSDKVLDIK